MTPDPDYDWGTQDLTLRDRIAALCAHAETRDGRVSARLLRQALKDTR